MKCLSNQLLYANIPPYPVNQTKYLQSSLPLIFIQKNITCNSRFEISLKMNKQFFFFSVVEIMPL